MSLLQDPVVMWRITWSLGQSLALGACLVAVTWLLDHALRRRGAEARYRLHLAVLVLLGASLPVLYWYAPTDQIVATADADVSRGTGGAAGENAEGRADAAGAVERPSMATTARDSAADVSDGVGRELAVASESPALEVGGNVGEPRENGASSLSGVGPQVDGAGLDVFGLLRVASPWIARGYLVGVLLMLARLGSAIWGSRRLRRAARVLSEGELPAGFRQRCRRMGLRVAPTLARCERVATPVVIGALRPMILVPSALLTGMSPEQLLDVLAHELAHLRRYDHWALLVQRAIEVSLFFHPAAWWLSRRVETLRELNCDDRVVAAGSDPLDYVQALARVAELTWVGADRRAERAALAADGASPSRLRRRIERLLGASEEPSVRLSGGACAALVVLFGGVFASFATGLPGSTPRTIADERPAAERAEAERIAAGAQERETTRDAEPGQAAEAVAEAPQTNANAARPIPRQKVTVRGEVLNEQGAAAERDLEVVAHEDARILGRTRTDEQGRFEFRELSVLRQPGADWRNNVQFVVNVPDRRYGSAGVFAPKREADAEPPPPDPAVHEVQIRLVACDREIVGRVVDRAGRPLAGVRVLGYGWGVHAIGDEWPAPHTVTDEQGNYKLRTPRSRFYDFVFAHPQAARVVRTIGAKEPAIVLGPAGSIAGRVEQRGTERPLAGLAIWARSLSERDGRRTVVTTLTDAQGRYELNGLPPGAYSLNFGPYVDDVRLVPELPGPVSVQQDRTTPFDVQFVVGRQVRGRVLEAPDGTPVQGVMAAALVGTVPEVTSDRWSTRVETAADGSFEMFVPAGVCEVKTYVPVNAPYRTHRDDSARTFDIAPAAPPLDVVLKLGRVSTRPTPGGGGLGSFGKSTDSSAAFPQPHESPKQPPAPPPRVPKLVVHLRAEQPVGDHVVRVVFRNSSTVNEWSLQSGPTIEKTFTVGEIDRFARLLIDVPGFALVETPEFQIRPDMPPLTLDLPPARAVPVAGRVIGEDGGPIVGARVQVRRIFLGSDSKFPWGVEATTDPAGRFVLGRLRAGERIAVVVTREDIDRFETEPVRVEAVERQELPVITLAPPREKIAGTVVDQDGLPVPQAEVTLARDSRVQAIADERGRFELTGLPRGRSELKIRGPEGDETRRVVVAGTLDARLSLRVESLFDRPEHVLQVTLRAPADAPPATAKYFVVDRATERWLLSSEGKVGAVKKLDLGSSIRTEKNRRLELVVLAPGYATVGPLPITVEPRVAPISVDLRVAAAGVFRGRVVDENGRGVPFVKIGLSLTLADRVRHEPWRYLGLGPELTPFTDEEGRFELAGLPQGSEAGIYANRAGSAGAWSQRVKIEGERPVTLPDVVLREARRTVRGRVTSGDGRTLVPARVFVHDLGLVETRTEPDGTFELKGVPDGELLVVAAAAGYESNAKQVEAESSRTVEFKLRRDPAIYLP